MTGKGKAKKEKKEKAIPVVGGKSDNKAEIIGITVQKDLSFSQWYQEVVIKAELVEYYNEVRRSSGPLAAPTHD